MRKKWYDPDSFQDNYSIFILTVSLENKSLTKIIQKLRARNVNRLIIGQINVNSLRNKSEMLKDCITSNLGGGLTLSPPDGLP